MVIDATPDSVARVQMARDVLAAVRKAVRQALIEHNRDGNPIVVWRDGQVCWVPAEEIEIPEETDISAVTEVQPDSRPNGDR